jgi:ADP-heptose:LPS heptosyltransferase
VVSVDTAVAHLAAAMGRPTLVLLPFWPDWRWTLDRDASPWYPAARLFRQPTDGDWDTPIARVKSEIAARLGA